MGRLISLSVVVGALVSAVPAAAPAAEGKSAGQQLVEAYAPRLEIRAQEDPPCDTTEEQYESTTVDTVLGNPDVVLAREGRDGDEVPVRKGPTPADIAGLGEDNYLNIPGDPLGDTCVYAKDFAAIKRRGEAPPTTYAHIAREEGRAGLAVQYWFFWYFNQFNDLHEGDWEGMQIVFESSDPATALEESPSEIALFQHAGGEKASWDDGKVEKEGTHPVVYPAAGSHANFFDPALFVGSSAEQGVGCDDTRGPHVEHEPDVITIPSDPAAARAAFPWITFEGRWGELQDAFFNGPTGPNLKTQWTEPITWSDEWRSRAYAVPTGGVFGTGATDFCCEAVATGSRALVTWFRQPVSTLLVLGAVLALVFFAAARTAWRPVAPLRVARRRAWGQILAAAGRMYVERPALFLGIGILFIPLGVIISILQAFVLGGFGLLGVDTSGEGAGALALLVLVIGTTFTLLGLGVVQAATACALVRLDRGEEIGPIQAYRGALTRFRQLLRALGLAVAVWVVLTATAVLLPVAIWLAIRWSLLAQVVEVEENPSAVSALRRSRELVRGRWLRVASLVGVGSVVALAAGPLVGALLILVTAAPLAVLNLVAGVVYALAMPFVALTTSYVYFDARARLELDRVDHPAELPAEIELMPARPAT
jgi:hypothetical protein